MSDETSLKWHEIINGAQDEQALAFIELYREYAQALRGAEAARRAEGYWPFPRT